MSLFDDINKTLTQTGDSFKQLSVLNPLTIHRKGGKAKAVFALAMVCFFWGTTWIASRQGVFAHAATPVSGYAPVSRGFMLCNLFQHTR